MIKRITCFYILHYTVKCQRKRQNEKTRKTSSNNLRLLQIQVPSSGELNAKHQQHPQVHLHSMKESGVVRDKDLGTS